MTDSDPTHLQLATGILLSVFTLPCEQSTVACLYITGALTNWEFHNSKNPENPVKSSLFIRYAYIRFSRRLSDCSTMKEKAFCFSLTALTLCFALGECVTRTYYIGIREENWNYAPLGKNVVSGKGVTEDE